MKRALLAVVVALIIMAGVGIWLYPALPAQVPSHWNINGEVDAWQTPVQSVVFVPILTLVLGAVLYGAGRLDMRASVQQALAQTIMMMMVFFTILHTVILLIGAGYHIELPRVIIASLGVLFGALGQVMRTVEPNGFVGFRMFWTIANPVVWRETHERAATVMAIAALILVVGALLPVPVFALFVGLFVTIVLMVAWPTVYAYHRYHQLMDGTKHVDRAE